MSRVDGRALGRSTRLHADVAVVGSGPAGAAVARTLSRAGLKVVVLEEGNWLESTPEAGFGAMAAAYRDMGASVALGSAPVALVQGKAVGGSSPINGAICWRMPRDVWEEWIQADPGLEAGLGWAELEAATDEIEDRLGVAPTPPELAGPKSERMARGAEALGLEHRPTRRNAPGCRGSGRCLQGCPTGGKRSVDATLLADALAAGATVFSGVRAERVRVERGRVCAVTGRALDGSSAAVLAKTVVVAASAIGTPAILLRSGLGRGPVGHGLQGHPGVSLCGRFPEVVNRGATQGHEVIGLRKEGIKFETLGFGDDILAGRLPGLGSALARNLEERDHWSCWGAAIRSTARGRVRSVLGHSVVTWSASELDVARYGRAMRIMGEMMFAAGAQWVSPGVRGLPERIDRPEALAALEMPRSASAWPAAITHLFGTCRAGSDPRSSVVGPTLAVHGVPGLYVADSSVFPTNLGVNPQIPIAAVAQICARHVLKELA